MVQYEFGSQGLNFACVLKWTTAVVGTEKKKVLSRTPRVSKSDISHRYFDRLHQS